MSSTDPAASLTRTDKSNVLLAVPAVLALAFSVTLKLYRVWPKSRIPLEREVEDVADELGLRHRRSALAAYRQGQEVR
jgi:hypothetical protein